MKRFDLIFVFLLLTFPSCNDEPEFKITSIESEQNPVWNSERFKLNHIIQLPNNYEGLGMVGFEGYVFQRNRADKKIHLSYGFCGPNYCEAFGESLPVFIPISVQAEDEKRNNITLDSRTTFSSNGQIVGIFYYNSTHRSTGKYYMKQGAKYYDALTVNFDRTELPEVIEIIATIKETK